VENSKQSAKKPRQHSQAALSGGKQKKEFSSPITKPIKKFELSDSEDASLNEVIDVPMPKI
jgi:hypothetical protein